MQAENMAQNLSTDGGKNGAEIDIMESPFYNDPAMTIKYRNTTLHTIHVNGYGDDHKATNSKYFEVNKDIYNEFNTYGVLWTENEYVFYINGYETWRTDFGVSQAPEFLWLSVEIAGESGSANPSNDKGHLQSKSYLMSNKLLNSATIGAKALSDILDIFK